MLTDTLLPGFGLRISKRAATYVVVTRDRSGSQIRRRLGTTRDITPTQARERARGVIEDAQSGSGLSVKGATRRASNPSSGKATAPTSMAKPHSFKWVADTYLADGLRGGGARLKSNTELARKVTKDLAEWHDRPIGSITRREIDTLIRRKAQVSPVAANRLMAFVRRLFRWATQRFIIDANPAADLEMPAEEQTRERRLTDEEIRLVWKACDRLGDPMGRLIKVALATGQRRGEVAGLRRSELGELEVPDRATGQVMRARAWLIPAERTKAARAHAVPLTPLVAQLLDGAPRIQHEGKDCDHVFASGRRGDQPPNGWSKLKKSLDLEIGRVLAQEAGEEFDPAVHKFADDWTIHDLRRTAADAMEAMGVDIIVVKRVLNHAAGKGITGVYARYRYDAEAAEALRLWADRLERVTGANGPNPQAGAIP
jgi:integrase